MISFQGVLHWQYKKGTKRVFSFQQKQSYLFLQDIRAVTLISFSAKILI